MQRCWGERGRRGALEEEEAQMHAFSASWHLVPAQADALAAEEEWKRGQLGQNRQQGQWTTVVEILLHSVPTLSDNECQACVLTLLS